MRELSGLRYSYKVADPVMEDLEWRATRRLARMPGARRKSAAPTVSRSDVAASTSGATIG